MRTIGILAITSLLSTVGTTTDAATPPSLIVVDASERQAAELQVAMQLFVDEQLTLPELRVRYSAEPDDCYGHLGTFTTATTPWTITICSDLAFVPTHELAHAWLEANLDAATRRSYLHARHKASWNDKQAERSERGVEDAAFIIQQNLMITPPTPLTPEWQARADAYDLLTGRPSPLRPTDDLDIAASIIIDSASRAWTDRIQWGLTRFRQAGLRLPPLTIKVHADTAGCDGNSGLNQPTHPPQVHLCTRGPADSRAAQLITLHELAHAWAETQLTDDQRKAFLLLRGLDAWQDPRTQPHTWGAEHAAEIVSWGLMDEMIPIIRIYDSEPQQLMGAFNLLVGAPPLWSPDD